MMDRCHKQHMQYGTCDGQFKITDKLISNSCVYLLIGLCYKTEKYRIRKSIKQKNKQTWKLKTEYCLGTVITNQAII